eukprot:6212668-Pleurochrysis_carterae.AAC.2
MHAPLPKQWLCESPKGLMHLQQWLVEVCRSVWRQALHEGVGHPCSFYWRALGEAGNLRSKLAQAYAVMPSASFLRNLIYGQASCLQPCQALTQFKQATNASSPRLMTRGKTPNGSAASHVELQRCNACPPRTHWPILAPLPWPLPWRPL